MNSMEIKTFIVGLGNGWESCFERLDKKGQELGSVEIVQVTDTVYPTPSSSQNGERVTRCVVFRKID